MQFAGGITRAIAHAIEEVLQSRVESARGDRTRLSFRANQYKAISTNLLASRLHRPTRSALLSFPRPIYPAGTVCVGVVWSEQVSQVVH